MMSNEIILRYLAAAQYALKTLNGSAEKYFSRLRRLAEFNSTEELESIIRGYAASESLPPAESVGPWAVGAKWGETVRVISQGGIIWKLRCSCGKLFERSTNDTVPEHHRKCPTCRLADEFSNTKREINAKLDRVSETVLAWHRAHDNVVWNRVRKALRARYIQDEEFARELHALCWVKISERAGDYRDQGFKPSAWIGTVATNCIADHFKVTTNRERLAPTVPLISEECRDAAAPPTRPEELVPFKAVRPDGASPHERAMNPKQAAWDKAQHWNG
jgi:DNA-directed RNA polymerase specialized sigma24 family protein